MSKPPVLVTGAGGKTGGAVARELLALGCPVRAVVHHDDARSQVLRALGAEVVVADMHDPDQLVVAMRGMARAYYVTIFAPHLAHAAAAFMAAARVSRLEGVVQLSQWLSHRAHPSVLTRETWLVDRMFDLLPNCAHVIVNPGMFADNFLRMIDFASLLRFYPIFTASSRSAPVSNEDIGRVAARALIDIGRYEGQHLRPTGPQALDGVEMAREISNVLGHAVLPVHLPFWMFNKAARMTGGSRHEVFNYREYLRDHVNGAFSIGGGVNDVVERMTGKPAESFATIAARYASQPFAQPTPSNLLKAVARFSVLPLVPGYNLSAYQRRMQFPVPAVPSLSTQDAKWLSDHGFPAGAGGAVDTASSANAARRLREEAPVR